MLPEAEVAVSTAVLGPNSGLNFGEDAVVVVVVMVPDSTDFEVAPEIMLIHELCHEKTYILNM